MRRIAVREGEPIYADPLTAEAIRQRLTDLKRQLRPRVEFLTSSDSYPVVQNLVGSVQITPDIVLDVAPKVGPDMNWSIAVLDLIVSERVNFDTYAPLAEKSHRNVLPDAFAQLFAEQLERAFQREGPLSVIMRVPTERPLLRGRLDVTRWVSTNLTRPHVFPQDETVLTVDNPYTSAMVWVGEALAVRSSSPHLAARLRAVTGMLRPGLARHTSVDPGVALRPIPPQWRVYEPAWNTTCAVLNRISPIHRSGTLDGFGLAVEPWPLLETLLHRALRTATRLASEYDVSVTAQPHSTHPLLRPLLPVDDDVSLSRVHDTRNVEPDGSLWSGHQPLATFEAKYTNPAGSESIRAHVFQAVTAAHTVGAPLAVLVYPEASKPVIWEVAGPSGNPIAVAAIGLDMFGYRRGRGDDERGRAVLELLRQASILPQPA